MLNEGPTLPDSSIFLSIERCSKDTLALTEPMRDDPINYVRQVALTSMLDSIQRLKLMVPVDYIAEAPDVSPSVLTPNHVEAH